MHPPSLLSFSHFVVHPEIVACAVPIMLSMLAWPLHMLNLPPFVHCLLSSPRFVFPNCVAHGSYSSHVLGKCMSTTKYCFPNARVGLAFVILNTIPMQSKIVVHILRLPVMLQLAVHDKNKRLYTWGLQLGSNGQSKVVQGLGCHLSFRCHIRKHFFACLFSEGWS